MFHSLRQTEPGVYDNFVEYVANTISNEQILQFMEMYDPIDSQGLLEGLQINGQYNLDEILKDPKKYTSQYQSLLISILIKPKSRYIFQHNNSQAI